jgi:hypothetical protein
VPTGINRWIVTVLFTNLVRPLSGTDIDALFGSNGHVARIHQKEKLPFTASQG